MSHPPFSLCLATAVLCLTAASTGYAGAQTLSQASGQTGGPVPLPGGSADSGQLQSPPLRPYNPPPADLPGSAANAQALVPTTTQHIDGYHVRRYLGVVRGVKVFQPTVGESLRASLKGIVGGNIGAYTEMCDKARQQAYDQLIERSTALGANAILGLRFDSSSFGSGGSEMGTEIICYGTAVVIEPDR